MKTAFALICHGSRDPRWCDTFVRLAQTLQSANPTLPMALCYMEIASPTLMSVVSAWLQSSDVPDVVRVLPLFMAGGGHVDHDIPTQIAEVQRAYPDLDIAMLRPVGEHPLVVAAMGDIMRELAFSHPV